MSAAVALEKRQNDVALPPSKYDPFNSEDWAGFVLRNGVNCGRWESIQMRLSD
ncbi:hypothetical protein THIOM_004058 [Candidatus Thiomargarita nelsonii]|uniref:Uncharacterized protein n=1 Tax=Candidatus Thiomargarita nelsonii TaxID=1003181 RepID=A0A176RX35_9GAMM|nr:hypothetical protein THIOM_004058 [Candidatus Thiomargarita nelsonii]